MAQFWAGAGPRTFKMTEVTVNKFFTLILGIFFLSLQDGLAAGQFEFSKKGNVPHFILHEESEEDLKSLEKLRKDV